MNTENELPLQVLALRENTKNYNRCNEDDVAVEVSSHLLMRHAQLNWLEKLASEHTVHLKLVEEFKKNVDHSTEKNSKHGLTYFHSNYHKQDASSKILPEERAYRLAVTDLFVEKAQAFLKLRAESYQRSGKIARRIACVIIVGGAFLAWYQMLSRQGEFAKSWLELLSTFTRAFTAYGMVVLAAVGFWRYSKSMLDQAERLYERRHALRQGRLFVHLNDGKLSIEEMEKAFRWNDSQENAFARINTEASAPWGSVAKEFAKSFPEVFKAGLQATSKGKSDEK